MARSIRHCIVRNGTDVIASFGSHTLAEEAFQDLGCYLDERPSPEDQFEVVAEADFLAGKGKE